MRVFYHYYCLDGFASAAIIKQALGDNKIQFIPLRHSEKNDLNLVHYTNIQEGENLLFVDICPSKFTLMNLKSRGAICTILDHHISVLPDIESFMHTFNESKSGARLSWEFMHSDKKVPYLIELIDKVDLLKPLTPDENHLLSFIESIGDGLDNWIDLMNDLDNPIIRSRHTESGKAIQQFKAIISRRAVAECRRLVLNDIEIVVLSLPEALGRVICNELCSTKVYKVCAYDCWIGNKYKIGFVSCDPSINVSKLAEDLGGGGTRTSAAALMSRDQAIKLMKENFII